jgi:hypothetical protein
VALQDGQIGLDGGAGELIRMEAVGVAWSLGQPRQHLPHRAPIAIDRGHRIRSQERGKFVLAFCRLDAEWEMACSRSAGTLWMSPADILYRWFLFSSVTSFSLSF